MIRPSILILILVIFRPLLISGQPTEPVYLKSLNSANTVPLDSLMKPPSLIVTFQAGCEACKKQIQNLKCLDEKVKVNIFGVGSSDDTLKKELFKMHLSYPAFSAGSEVFKKLRLQKKLRVYEGITPQLLYFSKTGSGSLVGYSRCSDIAKIFLNQ